MPLTSAARVANYRALRRSLGEPDVTRRNRRAERKAWKTRTAKSRPFEGCDGEGAGVDEIGRQNYLLFRMGDRELYTGERLRTREILDFICDHPKGSILVGFAFGYDVTMILRDLPPQQQRRLFEPKTFGEGHSPFVWCGEFDIDYLPRQYFKVRRVRTVRDEETGQEKRIGIPGSMRTIYETFGFFQKSFLKVCHEFGVGTDAELASVSSSKDARGSEVWAVDAATRDYCAMECRFLSELMEKLRENCFAADIKPTTWNGAGKLSKSLHRKHETLRAEQVEALVPQEVRDLANMAYYGGRFEITRTGMIDGPVFEYDIASAYPDGMRELPCLVHGKWTKATAKQCRDHDGLFISAARFNGFHNAFEPTVGRDRAGQLGGLPIRSREGHLYWPATGGGIYWSPEIQAAEACGAKVVLKGGWTYHKCCDCQPFDWIEPLFEYRKSIGKQGPGYPIKLGINGLYGTLAQRIGKGQFTNMIWAGLTTALTRTKLNLAIAGAPPGSIVMLATDAVYSTQKLDLDVGDKLGQWELQELDGLFIVQPGLYWSPNKRKRKSRGLSGKFFEEAGRTEGFEHAWNDWLAAQNSGLDPDFPSVAVPVPGFIGLRLALSRNRPELAGTWISDQRSISFDYRNKRSHHHISGQAIVTEIKPGFPGLVSLPHRDFLAAGGQEPWEAARLMLEEQPDPVDLSAPWED